MTSRARLNLPHAANRHVLGSAVPSLLHRHCHNQQVRAFGFGWWANHLDRDQHQEARRRLQALHQKQAEAFNRRLTWGQQQDVSEYPRAFRRGGGRYWQSKRCFAFGRHGGRDPNPSEKATRTRSGQNTKDTGPGAWGDFLFRDVQGGKTVPKHQHNSWAPPLDDIRSYVSRRHHEMLKEVGFGSSRESFSRAPKAQEAEYVIDPITNRKVFKSFNGTTPNESNTFKSYRSGFSPPTRATKSSPAITRGTVKSTPSPITNQTYDADLPPTAAELRAYQHVDIDNIAPTEPFPQSEEYSGQHQPDLSSISDSGDANYMSWKYKGVFWGRQPSDKVEAESGSSTAPLKYDNPDRFKPTDEVTDSVFDGTTLPKYDDLQKYKPVKHNEPDGKPPGFVEQQEYDDLHLYRPVEHNEPDGKPRASEAAESVYDQEELSKYEPFKWNEPDGKPSDHSSSVLSYNTAELAKYKPFMWNEPDGQPKSPVELSDSDYDHAELQQYKPIKYNEPTSQSAAPAESAHTDYDPAEVQQYEAIRCNEPNGQPEASVDSVAEGLREYDLKSRSADEASDEVYSKILSKLSSSLGDVESEECSLGGRSSSGASGPAAGQPSRTEPEERGKLESAMARMNAEADAVDRMASVSVKSVKQRSTHHTAKAQQRQQQQQQQQQQQASPDLYSKEPQGLETSYSEECQGKPTWPTFVKVHGRNATTDSQAEDDSTVPSPGPSPDGGSTVYKILAYDPAMQAISIAETASTVHDTAAPLTPAEALLRLSHPTKFFPHFRPLEAQGFEIVSGSGDVLVFRKTGRAKQAESSAPNPIDKTGAQNMFPAAPLTTKLASSAGGSNLAQQPRLQSSADASATATDAATAAAAAAAAVAIDPPTPPKFRSNIDVRREEPVFSGSKANTADEAEKTKPGIIKRMVVGATWVAGVSYALGLVGEQLTGTSSGSPKK